MTVDDLTAAAWARWYRMMADPVIIDRDCNVWSYPADWDLINHRPRPDATPRP